MRAKQVITGALVLGLVGAVLLIFVPRTKGADGSDRVAIPVTTTITIDPAIGETFIPPPQAALPGLTPEEAWAGFAKLNGSSVTDIPVEVTVSLGLLTLPVGTVPGGEMVYTAQNQLAYGFSWHSCPPSTLEAAPSSEGPCTQWLFLDASTGEQIDQTWQQ
jgi:hypothetical protein